jgi:hypothetical protein
MLIVSLVLPNIAVMPTIPGTRKLKNCMSRPPAAPYLKLNVNIMNMGNKRLQTT